MPSTTASPVALLSVAAAAVAAVSYGCSLALAHVLTPPEFTAYAGAAALVVTAGVAAAALIPLPLAAAVRTHPDGTAGRRDAATFSVAAAVLAGVVTAAALAGPAAALGDPAAAVAVVVAVPFLFLVTPVWGLLQGSERYGRYAALSVVEVVTRLVVAVAAAALGAGAGGALWGFVAGAGTVLVGSGAALRRQVSLRPQDWRRVLAEPQRWADVGGVAAVQVVLSTLAVADTVVVAAAGYDPVAAGGYLAVATLVKAPLYLAVASTVVSFPAARSGAAAPDTVVSDAVAAFVRLVVPATAVVATLPAVLGAFVLPAAYAPALALLPWLAVAGAGLGVVTVVALLLLALREVRALLAGLGGAAVALAGALALTVPAGPTAVAAGVAVGAAVGAVVTAAAARVVRGHAFRLGPAAAVRAVAVVATLMVVADRPVAWCVAVVVLGALLLGWPMGARRAARIAAPDGEQLPGAPHVLHLGFEDPLMPGAGGGSLRTEEINRRIAAMGYRVTVLTTRFPGAVDRLERHGPGSVRWVHIGPFRGRSRMSRLLGYVLAAPVVVRAAPSDVVVEDFCAPFSSMGVGWWTRRPTVGVVQWLNAREKAREYHVPVHLVERVGVRSHRRLIAVSTGVARKLLPLSPQARIVVIGNGVDPVARTVTGEVRGDDVVFVGRLESAQKGLDLLLDAWALVAPDVTGDLVVAGTGPDGDALQERARTLGVEQRVRFVGWTAGREKFELLARARLAVVPSRFETFGIVAAEALAVGTAVVAYDIDCLREIVPPDLGLLVPLTADHDADVAAFAQALLAVHRDPTRIENAGRRGPAFTAGFEWDALARLQEAVYQAAMSPPRLIESDSR